MTVRISDPNRGAGRFISGEYRPNFSSEYGELAANSGALRDGYPLAKLTAGADIGKVTPLVPGGANGAGTFWGFLFGDVEDSASTQRIVGCARHFVANGNILPYPDTFTAEQIAVIEAAAADASVIVRR